jgi:hypothetical protein
MHHPVRAKAVDFAALYPPYGVWRKTYPTDLSRAYLSSRKERRRFMSRPSHPSHTIRPSLVRLALAILAAAVAILRGRWEREMLRPLMQPDHLTRIGREKFRAMMAVMFRDDVRLRREIFEAAMRMLGREIPALPDSAFALPEPKTARGLWRRWGDYARMMNHAEWYAYRLARRLARLGCDALRLGPSAPEPVPDDAGRLAPSCAVPDRGAARFIGQSRARAPPFAFIANPAPCKRPLAGALAHA